MHVPSVHRMSRTADTLQDQIAALIGRYLRQNGGAPLQFSEAQGIAERFVNLLESHPLPRQLRRDEKGEPGEMSAEEVAPMVDRVLADVERASDLAPVIRQLVKACYYPEFKKCRDSYRERNDQGACQRQSLDRVRGRISGSHCVDCPYWTALTAQQHEACLAADWAGDVNVLRVHRELFLPEDFRGFRKRIRSLAPAAAEGDRDQTLRS
ncbi:MAG: hypothetical protein ABIV50_02215 [Opitutus sp.]